MSNTIVKDEQIIKTSMRLPKPVVKRIKQYALDHDSTVARVVIAATDAYLGEKKKK